jgi:hypothetical protein
MSYNINVIHKNPHEFFGNPLPGVPNIDPHLISSTSPTRGVSTETDRILSDMDLASSSGVALDDFMRGILRCWGLRLVTTAVDLTSTPHSGFVILHAAAIELHMLVFALRKICVLSSALSSNDSGYYSRLSYCLHI